ncbi:MAG: glycosyltransferase family 1 protein [Verrucomicrobiota bacterium]
MRQRLALITETFPPEVNGVAMTLNRLSKQLVDRDIDLQVIHPKSRAKHEWGLNGGWETVEVFGFPIPGYPEAQVGMPSRRRLRLLWKEKRPDLVHVATEGALGWTAGKAARDLDIPLITSFHTNFHEYTKHYHIGWLKRFVCSYLRSFHSMARANLVPDPDLITELLDLGFKNCRYFGRGVDTTLFSPQRRDPKLREEWGADEDTLVCIIVSRVAAEKNIRLVLESFRELKKKRGSTKMVVVGDGPERKSLEKAYPEVIFTGMKFDEELGRHYASADLFAFASETETFGNVILEAMASGLAVIAYDYAAGKQYVENQIDGILIKFGDRAEFTTGLLELAGNLDMIKTLQVNAREKAKTIPWNEVVDSYLETIKVVLAKDS